MKTPAAQRAGVLIRRCGRASAVLFEMRAQRIDRRKLHRALRQFGFDRTVGIKRVGHAVDHAGFQNRRAAFGRGLGGLGRRSAAAFALADAGGGGMSGLASRLATRGRLPGVDRDPAKPDRTRPSPSAVRALDVRRGASACGVAPASAPRGRGSRSTAPRLGDQTFGSRVGSARRHRLTLRRARRQRRFVRHLDHRCVSAGAGSGIAGGSGRRASAWRAANRAGPAPRWRWNGRGSRNRGSGPGAGGSGMAQLRTRRLRHRGSGMQVAGSDRIGSGLGMSGGLGGGGIRVGTGGAARRASSARSAAPWLRPNSAARPRATAGAH